MEPRTSKIVRLFALIQFIALSFGLFILKTIFLGGVGSGTARAGASPVRWMVATLLPLFISFKGVKNNLFTRSGAILALTLAFFMTLAHWAFLLCLLVYFKASYQQTKCQNWLDILCKGGMACELALVYLADIGSVDLPMDFSRFYRASWLGMALLGTFACLTGEAWASKFGQGDTWLITNLEKVPKGTHGAISIMGVLASFCGGLVVGLAFFIGVYLSVPSGLQSTSPTQLPIVLLGGLGGLVGGLYCSFIGATCRYSGFDPELNRVVDTPGPSIRPITGIQLFDSHGVNLVATILTAISVPKMALYIL